MSEISLVRYVTEMQEIDSLGGCDSDELPQRLSATAQRMRRARSQSYPPLTDQQLATVASLLGMRTRISNEVA